MKVAVDTDPLLAKPATGCIGVVDDAVAAAASNGHPWNPVPHLRAMWFRSDSGRADSSAPLDGLRALKACGAPLNGAISGRALYDGAIDLGEALKVLKA